MEQVPISGWVTEVSADAVPVVEVVHSEGAPLLRHPGYFVHRDPDGNYHIKDQRRCEWNVIAWSGKPAWQI